MKMNISFVLLKQEPTPYLIQEVQQRSTVTIVTYDASRCNLQ
jgi:hypothetical protein